MRFATRKPRTATVSLKSDAEMSRLRCPTTARACRRAAPTPRGSRVCASGHCSSAGGCRSGHVQGRAPGPARRSRSRSTAMTVPLKTRILLADDHAVVRDGLRMVLNSAADLEVVAEASDGAEAVALALLGGHPPGGAGRLDAPHDRPAGRARAVAPQARAAGADPVDARQRAVLLRGAQGGRLGLRAEDRRQPRPDRGCRATMRGEPFLYPAAVRALVRDYLDRASRGEATPEDPLTRGSWRSSS